MKKLIYILLFVAAPLLAQHPGTYNGKLGVHNGVAGMIQADDIPTSPENPVTPTVSGIHPITHDQTYISHPNVVNGDYIGQVHYLCTDTIFNERTGTYTWDIVSGNGSGAFDISSTGMITVADYTEVDEDYTLGIKITNGTSSDTASCEIRYRSGTEGTMLIYFDPDDTGTGIGTFDNPLKNISTIDNADIEDGMTVLFKRGMRYYLPRS